MKRIIAVFFCSLLVLCSCRRGNTSVVVTNYSGRKIVELNVKVYGEVHAYSVVEIGKKVSFMTPSLADSDYSVRVVFADGTSLERKLGYVTHGTDFHDEIVILSGDISLKRNAETNH